MRGKFGVRSPRQIPVLAITKQPYAIVGDAQFSDNQLIGSTAIAYGPLLGVTATVTPSLFAGSPLTYQWQRNSGGTDRWVNLPIQTYSNLKLNVSPGADTGSLTEDIQNGTQFRCQVASALANTTPVTSSIVTCNSLRPRATFTTQLANRTISSGAATFSVVYTVTAPSTGYGYSLSNAVIWYARAPGASNFSVVTNTASTAITAGVRTSPYSSNLSLTGLTSANVNTIYRAVIRIRGAYVASSTTPYWTGDTYLYSQDVLLLGA